MSSRAVEPYLVLPLRLVEGRSFYWEGRPEKLKTRVLFHIKVQQLRSAGSDGMQRAFLRNTHKDSVEQVKAAFPSLREIKLNAGYYEQRNDLVWDVLLRFPPSHRIEIWATSSRARKIKALGSMTSVRPIFCTSLNLRGFRRNSYYCAERIGRFIKSIVESYSTSYLLVNSVENDEWYFQIILACGRDLVQGSSNGN